MTIKEKARKAQGELLSVALEFFENNPEKSGPSDVTRAMDLFKGLDPQKADKYGLKSPQNDRIAQGLINELGS